jgi:hypothetical protein
MGRHQAAVAKEFEMSEITDPFGTDNRVHVDPGNEPPDKGHLAKSTSPVAHPSAPGPVGPPAERPASQGGRYPLRQEPGRAEQHRREQRGRP